MRRSPRAMRANRRFWILGLGAVTAVAGSLDGEVNSHAAWPTEDGTVVVETEEDFNAWVVGQGAPALNSGWGAHCQKHPRPDVRRCWALPGGPIKRRCERSR
jgi:hypothetical protein